MSPLYEILFVLCCHLILLLVAAGDENGHRGGGECPASFDCGLSIGDISFPFTTAERPDCGLLPIQNCHEEPLKPRMIQLQNNGKWFVVLRVVSGEPKIDIRDNDIYKFLESKSCEAFGKSYTVPPTFHFASFSIKFNATLFRCKHALHVSPPTHVLNYTGCPDYDLYYDPRISLNSEESPSSLAACTKVLVAIKDLPDGKDPFTFATADFAIRVHLSQECANCHYKKRGQCQLDSQSKFYCAKGSTSTSRSWVVMKIALPLGLASSVVVAWLLLLACCFTRKLLALTRGFWNRDLPTDEIIFERFLKQHGSLPTRRYCYFEIKKFTNDFKVKLGEGGYGNVYKGNLQDGRLVAVKVLSELKGTGEEFINEVASISRTSHVNIVTLVGFCFQGSKRALIYEFMPNGSLEKFIYEENSVTVGRQLDCKTLYDIAIGVARGLDYLHRGCNTKILHFDIKPHNILLDEDFCPKISDFGLAKICPRKESIVSMMCARGTIGYIAPEVFSRNFGEVSHKADVYSYGMMVLEMVGGRHNKNVQVDRSSELYFPHWIYNRLELNQDFGLLCVKNESDRETVRKMIVVSLWCIQTDPSCRPSMNKVVEMLEGSLGSLKLPPKPFLRSSPTSPTHYTTQTFESTL